MIGDEEVLRSSAEFDEMKSCALLNKTNDIVSYGIRK